MKAIVQERYGSPDDLELRELDKPVAGDEELWGNAGGPADLDGSGVVDFGDLLMVLDAWGPCPESRPLRRPVDDLAGNTIRDIAGGGAEPWAGS